MTLPRLEFNLVGPIPFNSGTDFGRVRNKQEVLSTYLTLIKSSSYWDVANLDITGSNYEALIIRPISSTIDQRIIITMNATASANAWSNRAAGAAETNSGNHLQVGLCPTSASYVHYTSDVPFGPTARWSRYWSAGDFGTLTSIQYAFIIESQETLMIGATSYASTVIGGYLGAIIVPFDSGSGEQNGRVFGMFTHPDGIGASMHSIATEWGDHDSTALNPHAGYFIVSGGNPNGPIGSNGNIDNMFDQLDAFNIFTTTNAADDNIRGDHATSEETYIALPYLYRRGNSLFRGIGFGRQCYRIMDYPMFKTLVTQSNGTLGSVGIVVNQGRTSVAVDSMLLSNVDV